MKLTFSRLIRRTHLLVALFLTPWVLMYALSTITMHHRALFSSHGAEPVYDVVLEESFVVSAEAAEDRNAAADAILTHLGMEGARFVRGSMPDGPLTVLRERPFSIHRITYDVQERSLRVERQRLSAARILEMMHRRRGFDQPFIANDVWALAVDLFIAAVLVWAATGLWMWWEMKRTRTLGGMCLALGFVLFALFLMTL